MLTENRRCVMFDWLKRLFDGLIRNLWGFLKQVISGSVEIILAELKDVAIQVVGELNLENLKDEEKQREAFKRIKGYAITNGIEARDFIINLAIELAVAHLKKVLGDVE